MEIYLLLLEIWAFRSSFGPWRPRLAVCRYQCDQLDWNTSCPSAPELVLVFSNNHLVHLLSYLQLWAAHNSPATFFDSSWVQLTSSWLWLLVLSAEPIEQRSLNWPDCGCKRMLDWTFDQGWGISKSAGQAFPTRLEFGSSWRCHFCRQTRRAFPGSSTIGVIESHWSPPLSHHS